ncbi:hypothetical protein E2C01_039736 [Portunus trituberculatus]|uniref:Uncharacterized protein n=1 Tax=Portunus trituberculatus TaxID=210409 RepID=A0A5B7FLI8_PORTR|nr:hypothetical protein [Portunus trituberculatus]
MVSGINRVMEVRNGSDGLGMETDLCLGCHALHYKFLNEKSETTDLFSISQSTKCQKEELVVRTMGLEVEMKRKWIK